MKKVEVCIELCRNGVKIPKYARQGDAGMDISAAESTVIMPGMTLIVPTGLKMAIPEGYEIQVRPRSGLSAKTPLRISNSPGTIDSGYRDEIGVIITNTSTRNDYPMGNLLIDSTGQKQGAYIIEKGDRIAQIVLQKVPVIKFKQVTNVKDIGYDRGGGFGSSGVKKGD